MTAKSLKAKKTTRRAAKPDAELLQWAAQRDEARAARRTSTDHSDKAGDRHHNVVHPLEIKIINTPAQTVAGLRVKTRMLAEEQIISIGDRIPSVNQAYRQSHRMFADRLAFSIWADAERLAKEGGAS